MALVALVLFVLVLLQLKLIVTSSEQVTLSRGLLITFF